MLATAAASETSRACQNMSLAGLSSWGRLETNFAWNHESSGPCRHMAWPCGDTWLCTCYRVPPKPQPRQQTSSEAGREEGECEQKQEH